MLQSEASLRTYLTIGGAAKSEQNLPCLLPTAAFPLFFQENYIVFKKIHNFAKKGKKYLQSKKKSFILTFAVTLIAVKREVAAFVAGFSVERMSS